MMMMVVVGVGEKCNNHPPTTSTLGMSLLAPFYRCMGLLRTHTVAEPKSP